MSHGAVNAGKEKQMGRGPVRPPQRQTGRENTDRETENVTNYASAVTGQLYEAERQTTINSYGVFVLHITVI